MSGVKLYSNLTKTERSNLVLNESQKSILIGLLLGDAHINQRSITGNCRLIYGQSALRKQHVSYFHLVFSIFKPLCSLTFSPKIKTWTDKSNKNTYKSSSFATLSLPCFNYYRELFYTNNVKVVHNNIYNLLDFQGLAIWIMDDGSLQNKGLHLNTYAFSERDIKLLMEVLTNKFKLKCSIHYHRKTKPRIYIWEQSMPLLRENLIKYMHTDMLYKISYETPSSSVPHYSKKH